MWAIPSGFHSSGKSGVSSSRLSGATSRPPAPPTTTSLRPAAFIHPGERTGRYRLGGDQLLVDNTGNSEVSAEDYAIAIADLLEKGGRERERITVAW